jgi:hypothetical protein
MNQYTFGSGNLFWTPSGQGATLNPTPYELATLQDVSIDMSQSIKELYGKLRSPVAVASTEMKMTGSAKFARFNAGVFNMLWGGVVVNGGQKVVAIDSSGLPGELVTAVAGAFTVAHNGANNYSADLGVLDTVTGLMMVQVAANATPALGQYRQANGVYACNSADNNTKRVFYVYANNNTTGNYIKIPNLPMGSNPTFGMYLYNNQWQGEQILLELYMCGSSKVTWGFKNADFMVPDMSFYFMDNGSGFVGECHQDSIG